MEPEKTTPNGTVVIAPNQSIRLTLLAISIWNGQEKRVNVLIIKTCQNHIQNFRSKCSLSFGRIFRIKFHSVHSVFNLLTRIRVTSRIREFKKVLAETNI